MRLSASPARVLLDNDIVVVFSPSQCQAQVLPAEILEKSGVPGIVSNK